MAAQGRQGSDSPIRVSTGVEGFDVILDDGLIARRRYLVRGGPGLGKTTLGLSFLSAAGKHDPSLFIGFQEPADEIRANASSVNIDVSGIEFLCLTPDEDFFVRGEAYDVFSASDVEQGPMVEAIVEAVERVGPKRVFVDSMTQLRFMSADVYQFRKQAQSFLRFLVERGATVMFTSEASRQLPDNDLQFLADGVINLTRTGMHSTIQVSKFRGSRFHPGPHQFRLNEHGFSVYPRLRPPNAQVDMSKSEQFSSGNDALDAMLSGGLEASTVTLVTGPTGIGKSTLTACYAIKAATNGHKAAVYVFEEELSTYLERLRALGLDVDSPMKRGNLVIEQIEPLRYLADEFTSMVRDQVEKDGIGLVVLDSVTGFDLALDPSEDVGRPLHGFAKTLSRLGVTVFLVNENQVTTEKLVVSDRDISYLCDNLIYLRYFQSDAALGRCIGILKKRLSDFDHELRLFEVAQGGIRVGPLSDSARAELSSPGSKAR